jgi:hypothetical protein
MKTNKILTYPIAVVISTLMLVVFTLCIAVLLFLLILYALPLVIFGPRTCISILDKVADGLNAMFKSFKHEIDTDSKDN